MAVLVIADHDGSVVRDTTHKTVTAALALSSDVDVLVLGKGAQAVADAAAKIAGVRKVLLAEGDAVAHGLAEAVEATVLPLAGNYDAILTPANTDGKNFAPRIAAKLDTAPISDIVEVVSADTFVRPIYAGNALETVQSADAKKVITVRPTAFAAAAEGGSASVESVAAGEAPKTAFVSEEMVKSDRPELGAAKIVVSGGRALGSAEEFHAVMDPLADKLGAAVGA
ncbi:MAG TPA: electron transfer flavoprotein subunit alpha, partial [Brevundimonas sp.]|nr:electron transfer flavoprotein subunit alpha [Brevundimonas sp.]